MDRAERRKRTKETQIKRSKKNKSYSEITEEAGYWRDNHIGCSCSMCKPWKHGFEEENKPSLQRKLQDDSDDDL